MKHTILTFLLLFGTLLSSQATDPLPEGFVKGDAGIESINAMTFGPDGILFIGDSKTASLIAIQTNDTEGTFEENINVKNIDQVLAGLMGTTPDKITIQDMAVNPASGTIYFGIHHENGTPALVKMRPGSDPEVVALTEVTHAKRSINAVVDADAKDRRGRSLREWAISDMNYHDGQVMVTGLSNKEFASTFRSLPYPFNEKELDASLEIYHAAHGQYETHAPVKTFTTATIDGNPYIVASYTCTPLVLFPMSDLQPGKHVKGRTVAELGGGNTPLDMVVVDSENGSYLMMANSNRPVMKINMADVKDFSGSLTEPVDVPAATAGVDYINLPMTNVLQLDKYGPTVITVKRQNNGDLDLQTLNTFWFQG